MKKIISVFLLIGLVSVHAATSVTVKAGGSFTATVTADGTAPFTYQWYKDGTPIPAPDGNQNPLVVPNVQLSYAGLYSVKVSNSSGSTTAQQQIDVAQVIVVPSNAVIKIVVSPPTK